MRTTALAIFLLFAWASPLVGEQFTFQDTPGVLTYRVANNYFSAIVRHPFRVVRLSGKNIQGTLRFNPSEPLKGLTFSLEIEVGEFDEPEGNLRNAVENMLGAPKIKMSGDSFTDASKNRKKDDPYRFIMRPRIELGKRAGYPEVRAEATQDGKVIRLGFRSEFTLSDFSIPIPLKWGVPAEDKVLVEGEINFTPKE